MARCYNVAFLYVLDVNGPRRADFYGNNISSVVPLDEDLSYLEHVPLEERLQLVILEPVPVQQPRECHLPVRAHGLHAVVHPGQNWF